MLQRGVS